MKRVFSPTLIEPSPQYTTGTEESWHCRRAFLKLILNEDKRLLKQAVCMTKNVALQGKFAVLANAFLHALPLYLMYGSHIGV